ncbi:MAG: alternative ribosome rescue aminoacyl-tRNA hydrolase ArfB [Bacteroidota bacterium]
MKGVRERGLEHEFDYQTSGSSGPGGQHVNKTQSRVELRWNFGESERLTEEEKAQISQRLSTRINNQGELLITSQESRSQHVNKEKTREKCFALIEEALKPRKKRKKTKPTRSSKEKRLKKKKAHGEKKRWRKPPSAD